MNEERRRSA